MTTEQLMARQADAMRRVKVKDPVFKNRAFSPIEKKKKKTKSGGVPAALSSVEIRDATRHLSNRARPLDPDEMDKINESKSQLRNAEQALNNLKAQHIALLNGSSEVNRMRYGDKSERVLLIRIEIDEAKQKVTQLHQKLAKLRKRL